MVYLIFMWQHSHSVDFSNGRIPSKCASNIPTTVTLSSLPLLLYWRCIDLICLGRNFPVGSPASDHYVTGFNTFSRALLMLLIGWWNGKGFDNWNDSAAFLSSIIEKSPHEIIQTKFLDSCFRCSFVKTLPDNHLPRYGGIKVGWKKIQRNIGHFLVLVEYISIALSYRRKKFTVQFFNN